MGLERVKDQENRREQENHNVGRSDIGSDRVKRLTIVAAAALHQLTGRGLKTHALLSRLNTE
jgi:hypothetical protein